MTPEIRKLLKRWRSIHRPSCVCGACEDTDAMLTEPSPSPVEAPPGWSAFCAETLAPPVEAGPSAEDDAEDIALTLAGADLARTVAHAECLEIAEKWAAQYPTDVFLADGTSIEARAAHHARRVAGFIADDIRKLAVECDPAPSPAPPQAQDPCSGGLCTLHQKCRHHAAPPQACPECGDARFGSYRNAIGEVWCRACGGTGKRGAP